MRRCKILLLTIVCAACLLSGMTACTPKNLEAHSWSNEWTSNINSHWRRCLDAGCNGRTDFIEHEWELTDTYVQPTCGKTGSGQYTCSVCKATLGNPTKPATIPATGAHTYKLETMDVDPTCGEEGYGSYVCEVCDNYELLPIPATGKHDFGGGYAVKEEGHYHMCLNDCGVNDEIQPHVKGEGIVIEPSGTADGIIEYRCTVCGYLMDADVITNPNVLHHFEVKFVKYSSEIIPETGDDGELYVTLSTSSNAAGGYRLDFTGYNADGDTVSVSNLRVYHYNEYTGVKTLLTLGNMGAESVGYFGYLEGRFYVGGRAEGASLLMESTSEGRETVSLKVHILTA